MDPVEQAARSSPPAQQQPESTVDLSGCSNASRAQTTNKKSQQRESYVEVPACNFLTPGRRAHRPYSLHLEDLHPNFARSAVAYCDRALRDRVRLRRRYWLRRGKGLPWRWWPLISRRRIDTTALESDDVLRIGLQQTRSSAQPPYHGRWRMVARGLRPGSRGGTTRRSCRRRP